jgi:TRAP-type C4-dicarboxylate transport system substrate-binding protein
MIARLAALAGASPVERPAGSLAQAFSAKRIDGAFASMPTGVAENLWTAVPAFFDLAIALPKSVVVFNGAAYQALAPEIQTAMLNATVTAQNRGWHASVVANNQGIDQLRSKGMMVGVVPPEVLDALKKFGATIEREWVQRAGAEGKTVLDDYRRIRTTSAQ